MEEISRLLLKMGVKFWLLERVSRFKWLLFPDKGAANNALSNKFIEFIESKFKIEILWFKVFHKVVIKGVPTDATYKKIWSELKKIIRV